MTTAITRVSASSASTRRGGTQFAPTTPAQCEQFSFGLGRQDGLLVLRYRSTGRLELGDCRQDFLHQVHWSPDGVLSVTRDGRTVYVGGDAAFFAARGTDHEIRAHGGHEIYRICVRSRPHGLARTQHGVLQLPSALTTALRAACRPGAGPAEANLARDLLLVHADQATANGVVGLGHAAVVARQLATDPGDPATLSDWAGRLHISAKTLQRDFERSFGVPFSTWRTTRRLTLARALLHSDPVGRVAGKVGYQSTSAFIAAFRREFGCTPTQAVSRIAA